MRIRLLSIVLVLTTSSAAVAQNAPSNLATVLRDWELAMSKANDLSCAIHRTAKDKALKTTDNHDGFIFIMKDGKANRVRYELSKSGTKELAEKWIVTNKDLYEYAPASKIVRVHALPKDPNGAFTQPAILSLITGVGAAERFDISLQPGDANYHYLLIKPRLPDDKTEFREVQLSLLRADHLPRRITLLSSNSTEVTWDFTKVRTNTSFDKRFLDADVKGWKMDFVK